MKFPVALFLLAFPAVASAAGKKPICVPGYGYTDLGAYDYTNKNNLFYAKAICEQAVASGRLPATEQLAISSIRFYTSDQSYVFNAQGVRTKTYYQCKGQEIRGLRGEVAPQMTFRIPWCGLW